MSGTRSRAARAGLAVLVASLLASCSKSDPAPAGPREVRTLGGRYNGGRAQVPTADGAAEPSFGVDAGGVPHVAVASTDAAPLTYTVTLGREAAAAAQDPDLAVIAAGRTAGGSCFTGIRDSSRSRSATIRVTVLPSGTVNRSEVSSGDTTEPWIVSCLESVGNGLHFADKPKADIRSYSIDVAVTRTH